MTLADDFHQHSTFTNPNLPGAVTSLTVLTRSHSFITGGWTVNHEARTIMVRRGGAPDDALPSPQGSSFSMEVSPGLDLAQIWVGGRSDVTDHGFSAPYLRCVVPLPALLAATSLLPAAILSARGGDRA